MSEIFATIVYLLCFVTSLACAWLLGRSFLRNGTRLLLWSAICFGFLALNNLAFGIRSGGLAGERRPEAAAYLAGAGRGRFAHLGVRLGSRGGMTA